ncbi:uncharacterized protein LOC108325443 isoform X2 [Vigna angularis]|uniref:uncharacterized protein LOC108325443 isoform X2 n=1 Tax=Phaseolus angularis TaxID=3914 RepID=UPI0022B4C5BB|nr:uncharacterized protein LOC108325443 isoform X2 [Vigna angularis]
MWRLRSPRISHLVGRLSQINVVSDVKVQQYRCCQTLVSPPPSSLQQTKYDPPDTVVPRIYIGENISRKDKTKYLYSTLLELNDSKETVYGALDAWVAWEQNFPIASLKTILNSLEKEQQWHRVVQLVNHLGKTLQTTLRTHHVNTTNLGGPLLVLIFYMVIGEACAMISVTTIHFRQGVLNGSRSCSKSDGAIVLQI